MSRTLPRALLVLMLAAIAIRIFALGVATHLGGPSSLVYGDAFEYLALGQALAEGKSFALPNPEGELVPEVFRTPGLPILLAPFSHMPYGVLVYGALLSVIAGFLLPLLSYRIGASLYGARAGMLAALAVSFEPHLIFFSFLPLTEMPFMLCALGAFWLLVRSGANAFSISSVLGGLLLGYAALIKPGYLPIFTLLMSASAGILYLRHERAYAAGIVVAFIAMLLLLTPWMLRNHAHTSTVALSGAGWRNVYSDYLASVRALDKGTSFAEEKRALKEAAREAGIDIDTPANAALLRQIALPELWERRTTALKLETYLLASFVMHDGYYYAFRRFGFLPGASGESHSVSFALLSSGWEGISKAGSELGRQYFVPLFGRAFTIGVALLALWGAWLERRKGMTYLILATVALTGVASTAIGLGVESRLRLPVEPLLFMLASVALVRLYDSYANRYLHPRA